MKRSVRTAFLTGAVLSLSGPAWGQPPAAGETPPSSSPAAVPVTPPAVRGRVDARYPTEAFHARLEATVGLDAVIDETGRVVDARVTAPAGHGFDEAALTAVKQFTFEPARRSGTPVRARIQLVYAFRIPHDAPAPAPATAPTPEQWALVTAIEPRVPIGAPPERNAASDSSTARDELSLRPIYRAEGTLEAVPGLFSVQHAGGGKAQQDFARGFNLDHGTDMAFFVDGVPINAVSHAHGQGYSDLHFLIPETVASIDSTKGTYAAEVGDFGTAGSTSFHLVDHTDESLAKLELAPSTGHERVVVVESPDFGDRWRVAVAAEAFHEDGPFIHPEDYDRLSAYLKATRVLDERSELSVMAMAYSGSWNMSGVLPARAVCGEGDRDPTTAAYSGSNCISRWDSIDPTQGGASQRAMAWTQYRRQFDRYWDASVQAYSLHSNLQLFPNDGIAAQSPVIVNGVTTVVQPDGILYGSQIEQDDTRTQSGVNVKLTRRDTALGVRLRTTLGMQIRDDDIEVQLHRTEARKRLDGIDANIPGPLVDERTNETETGVYAEEEVRPANGVRFVLGARGDRVDVAVNNESQTALHPVSGYKGQAQFSPKATAVITPFDALDLFANYGRGFHSNDARTLVEGAATTLIATARGYEIGATLRPVSGLVLSAVGFLVDLTSELVLDGDTASVDPSGPTRRYGIEATGHYDFDKRVYADVSFTAAHGRFTDARDVAAGTVYLPDAPIRTFSASVGARQPFGTVTLLGSVTVRSMSHRYGDPGPDPLVETGWTVVNAEAGVRWRGLELAADLFNVADVKWREGQFEVHSRLPLEGPNPPPGISFTPGLPRTLMAHAAVYW
jgi:TonB family protein